MELQSFLRDQESLINLRNRCRLIVSEYSELELTEGINLGVTSPVECVQMIRSIVKENLAKYESE
jgi:hypothetical protein